MKNEIANVLASVPDFIEGIVEETLNMGIDIRSYPMDHFCFRVETQEQYLIYKDAFSAYGLLISEAVIGGRPIATYRLKTPIHILDNKHIACVEIPSPKEGVPYSLGLEHVECVVPEALSVFIQRFPQLKFDIRALKKPINPEIALKLPSGKSVKFHNQSLEQVIEIEKKLQGA